MTVTGVQLKLLRARARAALYPLRARRAKVMAPPSAIDAFTHLLHAQRVTHVADVGANRGHFGEAIRARGFAGTILAFEPLDDAYRMLAERAAIDDRWLCEQMVLGPRAEGLNINVSANSVSSSVLPIEKQLTEFAPDARYTGVQPARQCRLDEVMGPILDANAVLGVKLDVQGYELRVLDGATGVLDAVRVMQVELSLAPLYEGQPSWRAVIDQLETHGFELHALEPMFFDHATRRTLQVDAVFTKDG